VPNIIVCGHSDCGAMRAVLEPERAAKMPTVSQWLRHADVARQMVLDGRPEGHLDSGAVLQRLIEENVLAQLDHLRTHPSVAVRIARGALELHGWVYHIGTGVVEAFDAESGDFVPLDDPDQIPRAALTPKRRSVWPKSPG
jgi:carbonic anhydrase